MVRSTIFSFVSRGDLVPEVMIKAALPPSLGTCFFAIFKEGLAKAEPTKKRVLLAALDVRWTTVSIKQKSQEPTMKCY